MKTRTGFTLIELLVVIAIISILAAIIMPAFSKAIAKSKQAVCMSNLRQIGMEIQMYFQDGEIYPGPDSVIGTGGIYDCPSSNGRILKTYSYEINALIVGMSDREVPYPHNTIAALDSTGDNGLFEIGSVSGDTVIPLLTAEYPNTMIPNPIDPVHLGMINVVYADGHIEAVHKGQFTASMLFLH